MNLPRRPTTEALAADLILARMADGSLLDGPTLGRIETALRDMNDAPRCDALEPITCPACSGSGALARVEDGWNVKAPCTYCEERGEVCPRCYGVLGWSGYAPGTDVRAPECVDCGWQGQP